MRLMVFAPAMVTIAGVFAQTADFVALARHATELQQSGDYAGAAAAYEKLSAIHPDDVVAHVNRGVCLVQLGRFDDAIAEYRVADKLLPNDPRILMNLGLAYQKSGRLAQATELFGTLHQAHPEDSKLSLLLADCSLQSGDYPRVIEILLPIAPERPDDLGLAYMLGMAYLRTGKVEAAQVFLDRILRNGDSAEAHFLMGVRMFESGDYPAAVRELSAAAQLNPKLPQLQSFYGLALLYTGDPDGANEAFRKELAVNPTDFAANSGLSQIAAARAAPRKSATSGLDPGPQVGETAPDFELPNPASGRRLGLKEFLGKSPVVLIFGSYSCPNFRSAAVPLKKLAAAYASKARFVLVYIREAHASGDWQSTRNIRQGVVVPPAATLAEKENHALMCSRQLHLPFPAVVDGMDGAVERQYNAWPSRVFIIGVDGRVKYSTRLTELDFNSQEMESVLAKQ